MPLGCKIVELRGGDQVQLECGSDIGVKFINIHNDSYAEDWEV